MDKPQTATLPTAGMPGEWHGDSLPVATYACDRHGVIISYNRRAAELWGRAPRLGDPAERYCGSLRLYRADGTVLPHSECAMAKALVSGVPVRNQDVIVERAGGTRHVALVNITVLRDAAGRIIGAVNCFIDVTERRRLEDELRKSRDDHEDFFEHAVLPMHCVRLDGVILRANQAELELLGYVREEYVGKHIADFYVDRPVIDDILAQSSTGAAFRRHPVRLRRKDGAIRHAEISSNVRSAGGVFTHTRCVTVDVTA